MSLNKYLIQSHLEYTAHWQKDIKQLEKHAEDSNQKLQITGFPYEKRL